MIGGKMWAIAGDSIFCGVGYDEGDPEGESRYSVTSTIQNTVNVNIHNFSAGAAHITRRRDANGKIIPIGLVDRISAFWYLRGIEGIDGVLITAGINDYFSAVPNDEIIEQYTKIIKFLKIKLGILVVVVTPIRHMGFDPYETYAGSLQELRDRIQTMCASLGVMCLDGLQYVSNDAANFLMDGAHLRAPGHSQLASGLIADMQSATLWPASYT
jgi:lysophospholipase L1-like esterase